MTFIFKRIQFSLASLFLVFILHGLTASAQDTLKTQTLKEVAVTASKPVILYKPGKIVYDLQADPESKSKSVLGMMPKIPFISMDAQENILLKGNPDFKVYINGKPSGMLERNLKEILRSMPASTIQSIEVITVPSSKYDLEGLAGIINIITTKRISEGYNGTVNLNGRLPVGGPGAGGSFTVKEGKFTVSALAGGSIYNTPFTENSSLRTTTGNSPTSLSQNGGNKTNSRNGYLGTELSYELDSLNLISGQLSLNGNQSNAKGWQVSQLNGGDMTLQKYQLNNSNRGYGNGIDGSLNYQLGFKADRNRLLTFSYRYSSNLNDRKDQIDVLNLIDFPTPDYHQDNRDKFSEHTLQIDYMFRVKQLNIEAGVKGILRDNSSDYQYLALNPGNNLFELNSAFSDQFNYKQHIFSAYNTYEFMLNSWSFNGGVRFEKTVINADFQSDHSTVDQGYLNAVPSLSVSKNFKNGNSLNFGFTQRIKRPGINRLNPFIDRSNPAFENTGNPELRPSLVNSIKAGYNISKKVKINIGADYSFINNAVLSVSSFDPTMQITRNTYENSGKIKGLSGFVYINYPITKNWNISLNSNVIYFWIEGVSDGIVSGQQFLSYYANLSSGYSFGSGWRLNADISVKSKDPTGFQGTKNGYVNSSAGLGKDLIKNKLTFAITVNNPFSKYRDDEITTIGPNFFQTNTTQTYFRSFNASLNYKFGALKGGVKKNRKEIKNDDVSNK